MLFAGEFTISILLCAIVCTVLSGVFFRRKIAGITGDSLGAANQFVELATYLLLAAIVS
jgi:adenosylcobinamide-GDP ribazoletransferase